MVFHSFLASYRLPGGGRWQASGVKGAPTHTQTSTDSRISSKKAPGFAARVWRDGSSGGVLNFGQPRVVCDDAVPLRVAHLSAGRESLPRHFPADRSEQTENIAFGANFGEGPCPAPGFYHAFVRMDPGNDI
jgi:hypothetical protein